MANAQITITANTKQAERALGRVNGAMGSIQNTARIAGAAITAVVTGTVLRNIVQTTARFQDLRTALASVAGGARQGAQAFDFISDFSTKTQFGVEELTTAYIKLQAAGIQPTEALLTTFTDTAAVTTDQLGSLQAMTDLFSRTTAGGLGLEELNRLADRGIPVFDILQEKLGRTRLELSDLGKTAEGANLITKALQDGLNERFGGATAARINNVSTQFSNLQIAIQNASDTVGRQGFALALGETATEITNVIGQNKSLVQEIGVRLTQAFLIARSAIKLVIDNIKFLGMAFGAFFALKIGMAVGGLAIAFGSTLVKGLVTAGRALKALTAITMANPLIAAAVVIAGGIEYLTGAFSKLFATISGSDVAESTLDSLQGAMGKLGDTIGLNTDSFEEFLTALGASEDEARRLAAEAQKLADSTSDTATAGAVVTNNYKDQVTEIGKKAKTYAEVLASVEKEHQLSLIALETDRVTQELMKAELELGRALTEEERKQLNLKLQQTNINRERLNYQTKLMAMAQSYADAVMHTGAAEINMLNESRRVAEEILEERLAAGIISNDEYYSALSQLDYEYLIRKEQLNKASTDKVNAYNLAASKANIEAVIRGEQQIVDARTKGALQNIARQEKFESIVKDRIEFEKKSEYEKAQWAIQQGASVFESLAANNKEAFEAAKAFNIANAIMNTYTGATKALATYPPPFNFIAAAAVVAGGLAQVASIRSQQYSGRQLGGPVMGNKSYIVGEAGPEVFTPTNSGNITRNGDIGRGGETNVNFTIVANDSQGFDDLLIQRQGMIKQMISDAMIERGQRSMI